MIIIGGHQCLKVLKGIGYKDIDHNEIYLLAILTA